MAVVPQRVDSRVNILEPQMSVFDYSLPALVHMAIAEAIYRNDAVSDLLGTVLDAVKRWQLAPAVVAVRWALELERRRGAPPGLSQHGAPLNTRSVRGQARRGRGRRPGARASAAR